MTTTTRNGALPPGRKRRAMLTLITLSVGQRDKCVTQIKGTWVNAWYGTYLLKGSPQAIQFLYHTGLGAKNSMGFGLFDIVK